jgi:hypothetical protein
LKTIIAICGPARDRSGIDGVSNENFNKFIDACSAYSNWHNKQKENYLGIMPYGENTQNAFVLFNHLKSKIDDYFLRCKLAEFDPQTTEILNGLVGRIEEISTKNLSECIHEISAYPIAKIESNKALPIENGINPAWQKDFYEFITITIFQKKSDYKSISGQEWEELKNSFSAYSWTFCRHSISKSFS